MPKYLVNGTIELKIHRLGVTVEAENAEEAEDLAVAQAMEGYSDVMNLDLTVQEL